MPAAPTTDPTCRLERVAAFRPGRWNGETFTAADLRSLVANFKKYAGEYRPYVSLNHDDGLRFGRITDAYLDGDTLFLDLDDVPAEVGRWVNEGRLAEPSIEFWTGADYAGKDGQPAQGRVLKCLTLLGNQPPAVKGMPPLPAAQFAHRGRVRRFAGTPGRSSAGMSPAAKREMLLATPIGRAALTRKLTQG